MKSPGNLSRKCSGTARQTAGASETCVPRLGWRTSCRPSPASTSGWSGWRRPSGASQAVQARDKTKNAHTPRETRCRLHFFTDGAAKQGGKGREETGNGYAKPPCGRKWEGYQVSKCQARQRGKNNVCVLRHLSDRSWDIPCIYYTILLKTYILYILVRRFSTSPYSSKKEVAHIYNTN